VAALIPAPERADTVHYRMHVAGEFRVENHNSMARLLYRKLRWWKHTIFLSLASRIRNSLGPKWDADDRKFNFPWIA